MNIPPIKFEAFDGALTMFARQPQALLNIDAQLYWHCQKIAASSKDPVLANNILTIAHHTLFVACQRRNVVPPPSRDDVLRSVASEMIRLDWDTTIVQRLKSAKDHRTYLRYFEDHAQKTQHPTVVRVCALRMFRIFDLL